MFRPGSLDGLELPNTILDAITLVRATGERYIWIDALCIPKDDIKARALQIAQMDTIYMGAFFTIVAACGKDANAGLMGLRKGSRRRTQRGMRLSPDVTLLRVISDVECTYLKTQPGTNEHGPFKRALCLCASSSGQRSKCTGPAMKLTEADWYEEFDLERHAQKTQKAIPVQSVQLRSNLLNLRDWPSDEDLPRWHWERHYIGMRDAFLSRHLSRSEDMLNAFTGIMSAFALRMTTSCLFGIIEIMFTHGLLWSMPGRPRSQSSANVRSSTGQSLATVAFLSWSWSAWRVPALPYSTNVGPASDVRAELSVYRISVDGRCARIVESSPRYRPSDAMKCSYECQWNFKPRGLPSSNLAIPDAEWIDSGHLKCWTSTSTAYIVSQKLYNRLISRQEGWKGGGDNTVEIGETIYDHTISEEELSRINLAHVFHVHQEPWLNYNPLLSDDDVLKKEIMVVARGSTLVNLRELYCIVFDRVDGVAYRVGLARTNEANWIRMERRWELLTLG